MGKHFKTVPTLWCGLPVEVIRTIADQSTVAYSDFLRGVGGGRYPLWTGGFVKNVMSHSIEHLPLCIWFIFFFMNFELLNSLSIFY